MHDDLHLRGNIPKDEPKNAHSHMQALLLGNDVSVPFKDGKLQLGQYQDVIFVELDGPKKSNVVVSIQKRNNRSAAQNPAQVERSH